VSRGGQLIAIHRGFSVFIFSSLDERYSKRWRRIEVDAIRGALDQFQLLILRWSGEAPSGAAMILVVKIVIRTSWSHQTDVGGALAPGLWMHAPPCGVCESDLGLLDIGRADFTVHATSQDRVAEGVFRFQGCKAAIRGSNLGDHIDNEVYIAMLRPTVSSSLP
jgi:hypothetical protein